MELLSWLELNNIVFEQNGNVYTIDSIPYYHIHHKDGKIFDSDFKLIISDQELYQIAERDINHVIYYFGSQWYWSSLDKQELNLLKYLGQSKQYSNELTGFLGIHGKYEILNGTRDYNDWCKKAKFLGYNNLGICEKHTLSGAFAFQNACNNNDIKPIIGEQLTIKNGDFNYSVKLYVQNKIGWDHLLKLHYIHNILNYDNQHITEQDILKYQQGLFVIICTDTDLNKVSKQVLSIMDIYYQLDFTEFISNNKDRDRLNRLDDYFKNLPIPPVLINDAYYLDSEDYKTKILLNEIGKVGFQNLSKDQYFKSFGTIKEQTFKLFKNTQTIEAIFEYALVNTNNIIHLCYFTIKKEQSYLPQYLMNEDEKTLYSNNLELFNHLIEKGFESKVLLKNLDVDIYTERLLYEIEVLKKGNVIDYFLILCRDVFDFAKENNILMGIGRGSSAGSLVAYLLGIVEVDPIEHKLLFERFLNEGRLLKGTLPDIDSDIPSEHRDLIIKHLTQKYGANNVSFIGTASVFKLKSLFKDLLKYKGESFQNANKLTSIIGKDEVEDGLQTLFTLSTNEFKLKQALNAHSDVIEKAELMLFQPRSFGVHAAGLVIVPNTDNKTIHHYMPMRMSDGVLVTEWEKDILEELGFLKLDLLGLTQLDKIMKIKSLIKQNHNIDIDLLKIDLDDQLVFEAFQKGLTEDIFQFGTEGLKKYCQELKPENIDHLIAANSLYRPGSMGSNSHTRYIKVKNSLELPKYYKGTENILEDTYSVLCYQEQIMEICYQLAGFSLKEADEVRKAIGKSSVKTLENYKEKFINGCIRNPDYITEDAEELWKDIEYFGLYSFNKSHSAAYAITGYYTQWLKVYFPIEFYSVALEFADDKSIGNIIAEINLRDDIKLKGCDINKSSDSFAVDSNSIYWGLKSISHVGDKAISKILSARQDGNFYSFDEFLERCGGKLDTRVLTNLVLCGAFDELLEIDKNSLFNRVILLRKFLEDQKVQTIIQENNLFTNTDFVLKQKDLCGYGYIDFRKHGCILFDQINENFVNQYINVFALVLEVKEYNTKNGLMGRLDLDQNGKRMSCVLWNDIYAPNKELLKRVIKKQISINVVVKKDNRNGSLGLQSTKFTKIVLG